MRKNLLIKLTSLVLCALIFFSGCANSATESVSETSSKSETVVEISNLNTTNTNTASSESESTAVETDTSEEEADEVFEGIYYGNCYLDKVAFEVYKKGEKMEDFVSYTDAEGNEVESGIKGLYYTLENVEVFENFDASGRNPEGKIANDVPMYDWNNFIVIKLTAKYEAPEGGASTINVEGPFVGAYVNEKMPDDFMKRMGVENLNPYPSWFYGEKGSLRGFTMEDGETYTFEIGLSIGDEFLENENAYLETHWIDNKIKGVVHKYIEIFPEDDYSWSKTKAEYEFEKGEDFAIDTELLDEAEMVNITNVYEPAIIKGVGDTLPGFLRYKYENVDGYECIGTEGIYITLDKVNLYDNYYASGLKFEDLPKYEQEYLNGGKDETDAAYHAKKSYETNNFVLLDLTAEYIAPEGAPETVKVYANNLVVHSFVGDEYDALYDSIIMWEEWYPGVVYRSVDYDEDGLSYFTISNGEKVNFQVGIKLSDKFIDAHNVFLCTDGHNPQMEDFVYFLFDLFPEE